MTFGERIKTYRAQQNITQKQMGERLGVTRQAISNWENGVNLPDLEMLVTVSHDLGLSLDELICADKDSEVAKKLIQDRKKMRRTKINQVSFAIGALFLYTAIICIWIKANSVEFIDASGMLHENFFLIPMSLFLLVCGVMIFVITNIRNLFYHLKNT